MGPPLPPILRSQVFVLLMILAIPMVGIAVQANVGRGEPPTMRSWYGVLVAATLLGAIVLLAVARSQGPKLGQSLDERANERYMSMIPLAFAATAAGMALLFATSSISYGLVIVAVAAAWIVLWSPRAMRRVGIRTSVVIQRYPAEVFAFVSDFQNSSRYMPDLESVEKITAGPVGSGTQFRSRVKMGPNGVFVGVEQIMDYEPPTRMTSQVVSGLRPNLEILTFEPVERGTLLSHRFESEVSYSGALIGEGLMKWLTTRQMVSRRNQIWARVKQTLESDEGS